MDESLYQAQWKGEEDYQPFERNVYLEWRDVYVPQKNTNYMTDIQDLLGRMRLAFAVKSFVPFYSIAIRLRCIQDDELVYASGWNH